MTSHRERAEKFLRSIMIRSPSPEEVAHVEAFAREIEAQALERAANKLRAIELEDYLSYHDKYGSRPHRVDLCNHKYSDVIRGLIGAKEPV